MVVVAPGATGAVTSDTVHTTGRSCARAVCALTIATNAAATIDFTRAIRSPRLVPGNLWPRRRQPWYASPHLASGGDADLENSVSGRCTLPATHWRGGAYDSQGAAGVTRPAQSPKPMRTAPSRSQLPRITTSSPSSRKPRVSPVGSDSGVVPRRVNSRREPSASRVGPEMVPLASKSPGRRLQPLLAWWVSNCSAVQYKSRALLRLTRSGASPRSRIRADRSDTSIERSMPAALALVRYGSGAGSPSGRTAGGTRNGTSASKVTIQGEIVVEKLLERNGPRGWYSQVCTSRADQSLTRHTPKRCDSASPIGIGLPSVDPGPTKIPISASWSSAFVGPTTGTGASAGFVWPAGRRTGVPLGTMDDARPWYPIGTHL